MSVSEDKVPGEEVGRLKAKDPDLGDNGLVNYRLVDGDGMNMFELSVDSETREAVIKLKKVKEMKEKRLAGPEKPADVTRGKGSDAALWLQNAPLCHSAGHE